MDTIELLAPAGDLKRLKIALLYGQMRSTSADSSFPCVPVPAISPWRISAKALLLRGNTGKRCM